MKRLLLTALLALPLCAETVLFLSDGEFDALVFDGGLLDENPLAGFISYSGGLNISPEGQRTSWTLDVHANVTASSMSLSSINVSTNAGGYMFLYLRSTNFTLMPPYWTMAMSGYMDGFGLANYFAHQIDSGSFIPTNNIGSMQALGPGQISGAAQGSHFSATGLYSMGQVLVIDVGNAPGGFVGSASIAAPVVIPEAATFSLVALGLLIVAWSARVSRA